MTTRLFNSESIYSDTEIIRGSKFKLDGQTRGAGDGAVFLEALGKVFKKTGDTWGEATEYTNNDEFVFHEIEENGANALIAECLPAEYKQAVLKPVRKPTYTLSRISPIEVPEDSVVEIHIATTDVPDGTLVNYYFSGVNITADDLDLTGSINIYNNSANVGVYIKADHLTEGTEDLRFNLGTGEFIDFRILDTSLDINIQISYSPVAPVRTGDYITFAISGGAPYSYCRTYRQDYPTYYPIDSRWLDSNGSANISLYLEINASTYDYIFDFGFGQIRKTVTVTTLPIPITYTLTLDGIYGNNVYFLLDTTGLNYGDQVPYTITGVDSSDINNFPLTGFITVQNSNQSTDIITLTKTLPSGSKTLVLSIDGTSATASVLLPS
jgi:hypothetical protein